MSLNYNLDGIENYETVCWEEATEPVPRGGFFGLATYKAEDGRTMVMRAQTHAIIFAMMSLGLKGVITRKNLDEAVRQFSIYQRLAGPLLRDGDGNGIYIGRKDLEAHIGLHTNCFTNGVRHFKTTIWTILNRDAETWIAEQPQVNGEAA